MKSLFTITLLVTVSIIGKAQNQLTFPTPITSNNINLVLQTGTTDFYSGVTTNTLGANGSLLGPTLIMHKDSFVNITVENQIGEETTIHWHGMHVSPENDGGPYGIIQPGSTWNPQFTVMDKAGTFWYHPHLHMQTDKHVSKGIAGLIIVRDSEEAALGLPMTYGIDEFPLVLQTKGLDANGQILVHTEMDTSVMVNGIVNAATTMPAQVVRFRVLNGSSQRVCEFGFSDNRSFSLIGTDGGLLTAPVPLTRYRMAPGQRADILVDLSSDLGQQIQLLNYSSELPNAVYGASQPGMASFMTIPGYSSNPLNGSDFQLLDITVVSPLANPITTIPTTLANYAPIAEASADTTRTFTFNSVNGGPDIVGPFSINGASFDMSVINETIPLGNTEIWELTNQTPIAHPFHIHDVQFFILDINGNPPPAELQGLNDVVLVPGGQGTVRFIAQFNDFASDTVAFMYHCHMLTHEDMGMMAQFLVVDNSTSIKENNKEVNVNVFPNPSTGKFTINSVAKVTSYEIFTLEGKKLSTEKINETDFDITLKQSAGIYILKLHTTDGIENVRLVVE